MALVPPVMLGYALVEKVLLEPVITGPLLLLLWQRPQLFRQHVLTRFPRLASTTGVTAVKWLVALGLVKKINQLANAWALSNWQITSRRSTWHWDREIAVVTGGSSGFGELVTKGLANHGLKVVVLDIQDLPKSLQDSMEHLLLLSAIRRGARHLIAGRSEGCLLQV